MALFIRASTDELAHGERVAFRVDETRETDALAGAILRARQHAAAALDGSLSDVETRVDEIFGLHVPVSCPGVPTEVLDPRSTWTDTAAYDEKARDLAARFRENFKAYADEVDPSVAEAGPRG